MDDEDSVRSPSPGISSAAASSNSKSLVGSSAPQRYLFLGWRNDIADMVAYLDEVAPAGSSLTIASPLPVLERERQMTADGRHDRGPLVHVDLDHVVDTCVSRAALERVELSTYDAILILSDQDCGNPDHADSRAGKGCEIPNFKGSYLGRFPLVSADFGTSDHLSERSRSANVFSGTCARGTPTLKRR